MIDFLLKSTLSIGLLYAVYVLLLEREKMHQFNRFYLLFGLAFSLLIPFFTFEIYVESKVAAVQNTVQAMPFTAVVLEEKTNYLLLLLWSVYGLVTTVLLTRFLVNLIKIQRKIKSNLTEKMQSSTLVLLDEKVLPHTFLNYIFINKDDYENKKIEGELFTHELTHVRQKHTLDILCIELLKTVFWFNPLFIFYKKAMQLNHEFLADETVVQSYNNVPFYQNLLVEKASWNNPFYLASNLNFLVTKKRLIMMTKTTSKSRALLKKIAVLPVLAGLIFISCSKSQSDVSSTKSEVYLNGTKVPASDMEKPLSELVNSEKFMDKKVIVTTSETEAVTNNPSEDGIYDAVEKKPDFPGGLQKFYDFIGSNFKMPNVDGLKGKVYIKFIVEVDGSLSNFEVMQDIGHGTGEEAIRVLKLSPKWIPGEQDGKKVRVQYSLPISISGS